MRDKTEKITRLTDWLGVRAGQVVYSRKTRMPRLVLRASGIGSIVLNKIRGNGTTTYAGCDRANFIVGGIL